MPASYPSSVWTPTTKTNKVDLVDASHINGAQDEIVAIESTLGASVQGSAADLKTRLAVSLDSDGSIASGSSFPASPVASQIFFRTDLDTLYVRNAANSAWNSMSSYPCHFAAKTTGDQTLFTADTAYLIELNSEEFDVTNNFDSSTNYKFTAPVTGKYLLAVCGAIPYNTNEGFVTIKLYKNGSVFKTIAGGRASADSDTNIGIGGSVIVSASATDYYQLYAFTDYGGVEVNLTFSGAFIQGS